eukprot:4500646-Pyramimonas_sp.AAC.1
MRAGRVQTHRQGLVMGPRNNGASIRTAGAWETLNEIFPREEFAPGIGQWCPPGSYCGMQRDTSKLSGARARR